MSRNITGLSEYTGLDTGLCGPIDGDKIQSNRFQRGAPMCMQSSVIWHKYPEEKPDEDISVLIWGAETTMVAIFSVRFNYEIEEETANFYQVEDESFKIGVKVTHWAYMPEGPIE